MIFSQTFLRANQLTVDLADVREVEKHSLKEKNEKYPLGKEKKQKLKKGKHKHPQMNNKI